MSTQVENSVLSTVINREYAIRFLGVAILFIALSGWFLYDGVIGYPQKNEAIAPIATTLSQREFTAADWMNTAKTGTAPLTEAFQAAGLQVPAKYSDTFNSWIRAGDKRAEDITLAQEVLKMPVYSADDIKAQFVSAGIGVLAAFGLLGLLAFRFVTRFTLDDVALTVLIGKQSRTYLLTDLERIDNSQWEKRGIAKVIFKNGIVVLDAWHHTGIRDIVARLNPPTEQFLLQNNNRTFKIVPKNVLF
jgi:hypothetical protein